MRTQFIFILNVLTILVNLVACNNGEKQNDNKTVQSINDTFPKSTLKILPPKQFSSTINNSPKYLVIDLRTKAELQKHGKIEDAVNLDFYNADFKSLLADLDKNRPIFVYCDDGERSRKACIIMQDMHFKIIYDLEGGLKRWKEEGYKIVQE